MGGGSGGGGGDDDRRQRQPPSPRRFSLRMRIGRRRKEGRKEGERPRRAVRSEGRRACAERGAADGVANRRSGRGPTEGDLGHRDERERHRAPNDLRVRRRWTDACGPSLLLKMVPSSPHLLLRDSEWHDHCGHKSPSSHFPGFSTSLLPSVSQSVCLSVCLSNPLSCRAFLRLAFLPSLSRPIFRAKGCPARCSRLLPRPPALWFRSGTPT